MTFQPAIDVLKTFVSMSIDELNTCADDLALQNGVSPRVSRRAIRSMVIKALLVVGEGDLAREYFNIIIGWE